MWGECVRDAPRSGDRWEGGGVGCQRLRLRFDSCAAKLVLLEYSPAGFSILRAVQPTPQSVWRHFVDLERTRVPLAIAAQPCPPQPWAPCSLLSMDLPVLDV